MVRLMTRRPPKEVLIGDPKVLDHLATTHYVEREEHPLQERLEEIIATLTEWEQELYLMRFGEQLSYRQIAHRLGYASHQTFQVQIETIMRKVQDGLSNSSNPEGNH